MTQKKPTPKFRGVNLKAEELEDYESLAREISAELGTTLSPADVIYMAKKVFKEQREAAKSGTISN